VLKDSSSLIQPGLKRKTRRYLPGHLILIKKNISETAFSGKSQFIEKRSKESFFFKSYPKVLYFF